jgi:type 1 glutamine amidotransferase
MPFSPLLFLLLTFLPAQPEPPLRLLVFTQTDGYRHAAIPEAVAAMIRLGEERNWAVTATEDSRFFEPQTLDRFDAVVFLLALGDVLDSTQQAALQQFVERGGGVATIHTGSLVEPDWPWFNDWVGATFTAHPPVQPGVLQVEDTTHPATAHLGETWPREDEWYSFDRNPRAQVRVLLSLDEGSYDLDENPWFEGESLRMGDHPIAWCRSDRPGRLFHTALGHEPRAYQDSVFLQHVAGGVEWVGRP